MANSTNSPEKTTTTDQQNPTQPPPAPDNPNQPKSDLPDSSVAPPSVIPATTANATVVVAVNPNPNVNNLQSTPLTAIPPPPQIQGFVPASQVSSIHPAFRPAAPPVPLPTAPQFSPIPNPNFQNHGIQGQVQVQPPGVMMAPPPSQSSGMMSSIPQMMPPPPQYGQPGQQPMRMYAPMPNGYQMAVPQGTMNPPVW